MCTVPGAADPAISFAEPDPDPSSHFEMDLVLDLNTNPILSSGFPSFGVHST
jgi:hypothetical protein